MSDHREEATWRDPSVEEVREARESLFAAAGYNIHEFCRRLAEKQLDSGHPLVRRSEPAQAPPERPPSQAQLAAEHPPFPGTRRPFQDERQVSTLAPAVYFAARTVSIPGRAL